MPASVVHRGLQYGIALLVASEAMADQASSGAAQANNPLANMTAFNFQNYYIGDLSESDETANQAWLRFAKPFDIAQSKWLLRASLPINTFPTPPNGHKETGMGDLNAFMAYLIDVGDPAVSFGVGPQGTAPTASKDELGSERWSGGVVNVLFNASSPVFQYGYLLSWQHSFAGNDDRENVNAGAFQPFAFYQFGKGTYLRSTPILTCNFESDSYVCLWGLALVRSSRRTRRSTTFSSNPRSRWPMTARASRVGRSSWGSTCSLLIEIQHCASTEAAPFHDKYVRTETT